MPNYDFNEIRSLGDAHKTWMYKFIISPLPGSGEVDERVLSMRNVSCELPATGINTVSYDLGGYTFKEAGITKQDGFTNARFIESMNIGVRKRLDSWLEICNERLTNKQISKSSYQTTCEVHLTDGDGKTQYAGTYKGFFITNLAAVALANKGNSVTEVNATFSYDLWVPKN